MLPRGRGVVYDAFFTVKKKIYLIDTDGRAFVCTLIGNSTQPGQREGSKNGGRQIEGKGEKVRKACNKLAKEHLLASRYLECRWQIFICYAACFPLLPCSH